MRDQLQTLRDRYDRAPTAAKVVATPYVLPLLTLLEAIVAELERRPPAPSPATDRGLKFPPM